MSGPADALGAAWAQLVDAALALLRDGTRDAPELDDARLAAIGWGTVETERAQRELAHVIGGSVDWDVLPRDALLGARAARARLEPMRSPALLLLEPDTEGRLAASLARHGEGVVAAYVRAGAAAPRRNALVSGSAVSALGPAHLLSRGLLGSPSIVVLDAEVPRL